MIEAADAAVVVEDAPFEFGCVGCERSELMVKYLIKRSGKPALRLKYPADEEEGKVFVQKVKEFLEGLQ